MAADRKIGATPSGSSQNKGRRQVRLRPRDAKVADATPDDQGSDITGGWEDDGLATVRINRAGAHLVGWFVDYRSKAELEFGGAATGSDSFTLFGISRKLRQPSSLSVTRPNEIALNLEGRQFLLRKVSIEAGISDNGLLAFPDSVRNGIRLKQRRPLCTSDQRRVLQVLGSASIGPFVDEFFAISSSASIADRAQRADVVQRLNREVGKLFRAPLAAQDVPLARSIGVAQLNRSTHAANGRVQSVMQWIAEMAPVALEVLGSPAVDHLQTHFGIGDNALRFYRLILTTVGPSKDKPVLRLPRGIKVGVGAGFFEGTLRVKRTETPEKDSKVLDDFELDVGLLMVGVGAGVSVGGVNDGFVSTPFPWEKRHFPGLIKILDAQAGVARGSAGVTGVFLSGDGTFPELAADFTGGGVNFGISAGASFLIGGVSDNSLKSFVPPQDTVYGGPAQATKSIHFPFAESLLTAEGRQLIGFLATHELVVFRNGEANLIIEAHADRVDTREYNELLIRVRAFNTSQALKDTLGPNFKVKKETRIGLGESEAEQAGDRDGTQNPVHRRVDITLNGRLVLQLQGE